MSWSLSRIVSALFGYDFFISYAHNDGVLYPKALARALEGEPYRYKVHLDTRDYHVGDDLGKLTRLRVRQSQKLVVVARNAALMESSWVRREVDAYVAMGRAPIIIDCDRLIEARSIDDAPARTLLEWLKTNPEILRQEELGQPDAPHIETVQRIASAFEGTRAEERRRRIVIATFAMLCVLLVGAVVLGGVAEVQRRSAVAERRRVELELSRADARQAEQYLQVGRNDAATAFLVRARSVRNSDLSSLVGHMLSRPLYLPTTRVRLPLKAGAVVSRAWADEEGRYLAILDSTGGETVQVYDLNAASRAILNLNIQPQDPVFRLVSTPHPAAIMSVQQGVGEFPDVVVHWLDDPNSAPLKQTIRSNLGYQSLVRLSDGRYYFAQGNTLNAMSIDASSIKVQEISTGLKGILNRVMATDDAPCMIFSDTSSSFVLYYVDGRPPVAWDGNQLLKSIETRNANHPQGVIDKTCRYAAMWFDGGGSTVHLVRLFNEGGQFAPTVVTSVEGDENDNISFRNRFFDDAGSHLFIRNRGVWFTYETATGRPVKTVDTGQLDSPGALTPDGMLLTAGYGDIVAYTQTSSDAGVSGQVSTGPSPMAFPLPKHTDSKTREAITGAFLTIASDGLVTLFEPAPEDRYEIFFPAPSLSRSPQQAVSPDGKFFIQRAEGRSRQDRLLVESLDGRGENRAFDCPEAVNIMLVGRDALEVVGLSKSGILCRTRLDQNDLSLSPPDRLALNTDGDFDFLRAGFGSDIIAVNASAHRIYRVSLKTAVPAVETFDLIGVGTIVDAALDGSGRMAAVSKDTLSLKTDGGWTSISLPGRCSRILGFFRDSTLVQCEQDFRKRLFLASADGTVTAVALPIGAHADSAALSPDGSTLVAPFSDSGSWVRQIYAQLLDSGISFIFSPSIIADATRQGRSDDQKLNGVPRIERAFFSADGSRMFLDIYAQPFEQYLITNGALSRFDRDGVAGLIGLSLSAGPQRSELDYSRAIENPD
ncbi:TIR domain-containing protein (plasmid) [Rhizobium leguminosarum]